MKYKEYIKIVSSFPRIFPTVKFGLRAIDWKGDEWAGDVVCEGKDGYGGRVKLEELGIQDHLQFDSVVRWFSNFGRSNLTPLTAGVDKGDK